MSTDVADSVDHVAILVRSIDASVAFYRDTLHFPVVSDERLADIGVRLAYVNAGNTKVQLVEPTGEGPLRDHLERHGEGLHHICFAVRDIESAVEQLDPGGESRVVMGGRGRRSAFLSIAPNGIRVEVTELEPESIREDR